MSDKAFSLICLHENKNHVEAKSATCTQPGIVEHWHCTGCGLNFSDEVCQNVLNSVTVPTVSHILTGSDAKGTFHSASTIKRSEAAAILLRMFEASARVSIDLP